jgi:hypothetical protein
MSDQPNRNAFENLTHSALLRINSKDDRELGLTLDVFNGATSFGIWPKGQSKPWKLGLKRQSIENIVILLKKMCSNPVPGREGIQLSKWEEADGRKGMKQYGAIGFGIDENLQFFIDIAANDLPGNRQMFPLRRDATMDFSGTTLSEKELLIGSIMYIVHALEATIIAERLTSFKKTFGANSGGGNRSGGGSFGGNKGGGNSWGGNSNGGGNKSQGGGGGTFSSPNDDDNDLMI